MDEEDLVMDRTPPILLTGCARSGTSLTAAIIDTCGGFGGYMTGPTPFNKKGQFENSEIRDKIVKPYLQLNSADPMGQDPLPNVRKLMAVTNFREKIETIMVRHGYESGPWYYKGAKMCLIWPLWSTAFPEAKWIIVRREDIDIADSCMHAGFMRAYRSVEGWLGWVEEHKRRFEEMKRFCKNVREVWPSKFIVDGDFSEMQSVVEWAGLDWKDDEVKAFIEPKLWKAWRK